MLRLGSIAVAAALLAVTVHSFAGVSGLWPLHATSSRDEVTRAAHAGIEHNPLDARSYYALGVAAERDGKVGQAKALMDRALRVDPRLRPARLWLLTRAAQAGQAEEAVGQAQVLARLSPGSVPAISTILADLSRDSASRRLIASRLKDQPLVLATATRAAAIGLDNEALLELLAPTDLNAVPNGVSAAQSLLVGSLLRDRQFSQARETWYALADRSPGAAVFDGAFAGVPASAPFGWTLNNGSGVETALEGQQGGRRSALKVTAFGSLPVVAAEQTLVLAPGRYALAYAVSPDPPQPGQSFAWRLSCISGALITEIVVDATRSGWHRAQQAFAVPGDCPAQVLRFTKLRTPDQRPRGIRVTDVAVSRL